MMAPMVASLIAPMASSLIQPVASSLINARTGKGVRTAEKGQEGGILPLLGLPLMFKAISGKDITTWIKWMRIFSPAPSFNQYGNY